MLQYKHCDMRFLYMENVYYLYFLEDNESRLFDMYAGDYYLAFTVI